MNDDGTMARMPELEMFADKHGLKIVSVADLVRYRVEKEMLVKRILETDLPTTFGIFRAIVYENEMNGETHVAMTMGDVSRATEPVLVRVKPRTSLSPCSARRLARPPGPCTPLSKNSRSKMRRCPLFETTRTILIL